MPVISVHGVIPLEPIIHLNNTETFNLPRAEAPPFQCKVQPVNAIQGKTFEIHMKFTDTLCEQNVEFYNVKASGTYSNHFALVGEYMQDNHSCRCKAATLV